jgi:glutamate racemase
MPTAPAETPPRALAPKVGVFDSGVGGLSVLQALHTALPGCELIYVADSAHAPYGERSDDYVAQRALRIAEYLLGEGACMLVVACNTATAVAVGTLRARWPEVPVVGVEPGVKPAVKASRNKRVGVMATPMTLRSEKFRRLIEAHACDAQVLPQACAGLAGAIERGALDDPELIDLVRRYAQPLREAQVDTVVLGCTHYPFVRGLIQESLGPEVVLIDTAEAVARQAARLLGKIPADHAPRVRLVTTGDEAALQRLASRWLPFAVETASRPDL